MSNKLFSYTIMPLDVAHLEEICQDIKQQHEKGIASMALFKMTLVPEGNPPADKVTILCKQFAKFKSRLGEMGLKCGILVQATVGHGWILGEMFPYQTHVNFTDGVPPRVVCPCDRDFLQFLYNEMSIIAKYEPDHVMIDDDLRLIFREGEGCACPLHLKRFAELSGEAVDKKELFDIINAGGEKGKKYKEIFVETIVTNEYIQNTASTGAVNKLEYNKIRNSVQTKNLILLRSKANLIYIFRKDTFTKGDKESFIRFLNNKGVKIK